MNHYDRRELIIRRNKKRREAELRRYFVMLLATVFIITASIFVFATKSNAEENSNIQIYKCYKSVCVPYGEDLYDLAKEYMDDHYETTQKYVDEVVRINHLSDENVRPGSELVVPYYRIELN